MATLDDIVSVNISLQSTGVSQGNFGTPMIVAPLMSFPERVRTYTSYTAAVTDGLPPLVLTALSDCFGQSPKPTRVKVGRRDVLTAIVTVSPVANSTTYSFTVGADVYSFTSGASATATEIVTGLAAAVLADTGEIIAATVVGETLSLAWIDGDIIDAITLGNNLAWGAIAPLSAGTPVADDLTAIINADNDWYGLVLVERVKATQLAAAAWTEATEKLFITATDEAGALLQATTDDLISQLQDLNYYRTAVLYHTNAATEFPDAAWAGRVFTIAPGGETWALKQLASITPNTLSATQKGVVEAKGGNTFEFYQTSLAMTSPGKVVSGEWIDVIRFRDWLKDNVQTNMVQMMVNRAKVPYTDGGIQLCVNNLRGSLQQGQNAGGIAPDELDANGASVPGFVITYPLASEVSSVVKATRVLSLGFTARLAGAIHAVTVTGSLAYEL